MCYSGRQQDIHQVPDRHRLDVRRIAGDLLDRDVQRVQPVDAATS
jgi:hypothetical protein